ncbi:unnamed protein product [Closterium sp. NIES-65]|nr:unnamed protein product [Closterium sp. NIES-65]
MCSRRSTTSSRAHPRSTNGPVLPVLLFPACRSHPVPITAILSLPPPLSHLQDPNNLDANVLTEFDHVKQNLAAPKEGEGGAAASGVNAAVSESIQRVLAALPKNDGEEPGVGSSKSTQKSRLCLALPPTFESTQK